MADSTALIGTAGVIAVILILGYAAWRILTRDE
jgi:hypothetical protein